MLKNQLSSIYRWKYFGLSLFILITLILHFSTITQPDRLVFDEIHYVTEARSVIAGNGVMYPEHPSLGKLFIISGIRLFGDNPLGWRFFPVLFGTVNIALFYFICQRLKISKKAQLLAMFFFSLENLSFFVTGIAMLDTFCITFMLCALLLYLRGNHVLSGIFIGLSALVKLTGVLVAIIIFLHLIFTNRKSILSLIKSAISAITSFLIFMIPLDYVIYYQIVSPFKRIRYMLATSSNLNFADSFYEGASRPWEWVFNPGIEFYCNDPQYLAVITPTIWVLIIPVMIYLLFMSLKRESASIFGFSWFFGTYLIWIPINLITDRLTYIYYFYPTVGAVSLGLGLGISHLMDIWKSGKHRKVGLIIITAITAYLIVHVVLFIILSPLSVPVVSWFPLPSQ